MENRAEQDGKTLDQGWKNAQVLRSNLKSGVRDDVKIHHPKADVKKFTPS